MIVFKYICFVVAMIATGLFINNVIVDLARIFTWQGALHTSDENKESKDDSASFASFRVIMILIMAFTWGVVFVL